ncbi:MAG: hypothetical protein ACI4TM_06250 [Candidatus Cryptobacteroides sp.]
MIKEQALIWAITLIVIIATCIIKFYHTNTIGLNRISIIDGLSLSFISAFIFYYFTVFFPESNKRLEIYQNMYMANELMLSIYDSIIEMFGGPSEEGFFSPKVFVEKLVSAENKELDEYTIDPYYMGRIDVAMNEIQTMYDRFSSEYFSYLNPAQMHQKTMINNAGQIIVEALSPKMPYKHVEGYFIYLLTFYDTLKSIERTISPYVYYNK